MSNFINAMSKLENETFTENGALTNKSTGEKLLDFFYHGAALRNESDSNRVIQLFSNAFSEDRLLALKILFYIRDVRGGQGERKVFHTITTWLGINYPEIIINNMANFVNFGRWDDLIELLPNPMLQSKILEFIVQNVEQELSTGKYSLLCKWLPAINASSIHTRSLAKIICKKLFDGNEKKYRKFLVDYRKKINIVETQMSSKKWDEINYSSVPSKASMIYRNAFKKHDEERYDKFIEDVKSGKEKINASVLYPYEIVKKYLIGGESNNETLNALWQSLPNYCENEDTENSIVVADVSGSMMSNNGLPMSVSISLAMYFAERNKGLLKDHFMTFSSTPQFVKIHGNNIFEKISNIQRTPWSMSTNLQAVFDMILTAGIVNKLKQEEMPGRIFIVSDMEFDSCVKGQTNYEVIKAKYEQHGYKLPKLFFWNVESRNNQTPITSKDENTFLISGCSPSIFKNAMNSKVSSAFDLMLEVINQEKYSIIKE